MQRRKFQISRASQSASCPIQTERSTPGRAASFRVPAIPKRSRCWRPTKAEFRYGARHEEGTQTAAETLALGSGTCRDFAVLMMEALRSLGLAARFVTGYLYDDTSGTTRGGGSTHAWCSVYLSGAGWMENDPTNGLVAGANVVRVGVARTAGQALPISGGYVGDPNDPIGPEVCVAISAVPIPESASPVAG